MLWHKNCHWCDSCTVPFPSVETRVKWRHEESPIFANLEATFFDCLSREWGEFLACTGRKQRDTLLVGR